MTEAASAKQPPAALADLPFEPLVGHYEPVEPGDILAVAVVRNEEQRLPAFLDHYRRLGVGRFFVVDNASTDETRAILTSAEDVVPFHTPDSYLDAEAGRRWTDALRDRFGRGAWCLTLDADELLVFPGMEHLDLHDLTQYCDRHGYEGVFTLLLDMYPDGPLADVEYTPGESLVSAFPLFDPSGYAAGPRSGSPPITVWGGVRRRVFAGDDEDRRLLNLRKTPLIRWREGIAYTSSTHAHSPIRLADITGALLHFKFMADFADFVADELARSERPAQVDDYSSYARVTAENPDLAMANEQSCRYESTAQLVELGLMKSSKRFLNDVHPTLRRNLGNRAAGEVREAHKAAMERAEKRFRPDFRQVLQVWDAFAEPPH